MLIFSFKGFTLIPPFIAILFLNTKIIPNYPSQY